MKFRCVIKAEYEIPNRKLRKVVEQLKENWKGEPIELFPIDLILLAQSMNIGRLIYDETDIESEEEPLKENEIP